MLLKSDNFSPFQICLLLLKHSADKHLKNESGETPVDVASKEVLDVLNSKTIMEKLKALKGTYLFSSSNKSV